MGFAMLNPAYGAAGSRVRLLYCLPDAFAGCGHVEAFDTQRRQRTKASFQSGRLPSGLEGGLYETGTFAPDDNTYPNGCHVCEVCDGPDTGALAIVRYIIVDDVGTVVNPIGLKGQIHGGVAQGLGQALMEQVVYDRQSGQNLTGSFMDYCMPRADTMPSMEITSNPVPTQRNPLGAKGAGEAGTVGALPAIVNAVVARHGHRRSPRPEHRYRDKQVSTPRRLAATHRMVVPGIVELKGILVMLRPEPDRPAPLPPLRNYEPPSKGRYRRRR
jgi:CO/xanthine dehydrogenase Mo-binding subunit